jgi:ribosomal-protein-serine acetyltransferase
MQDMTLRFPEPGDAEALLGAVRESVPEIGCWMDWCRPDYSLADAAGWIAAQAEARAKGTGFEFLVVVEDGRLLGVCGINGVNPDAGMANLGYWVRTSETGRGVAARAVRLLVDWVLEHTALQRIEIVVAVGNTPSQRVAEKVGALREGVLRSRLHIHGVYHDAVMHSIIRPTAPPPAGQRTVARARPV